MNPIHDHERTLAIELLAGNYGSQYQPTRIDRHVPTGFSGASIWRVVAPAGEFCLRKWPREHPTPERLRFIHEALFHAAAGEIPPLALPVFNQHGNSYTRHASHLWELAPWLPGEPKQPGTIAENELRAAMAGLAKFHRAVASHSASGVKVGQTPAIESRLTAIARFDKWADTFQPPAMPSDPGFHQAVQAIAYTYRERRAAIRAELQVITGDPVFLAPCLRDIWSDHVLFVDSSVTGIIDYGAMALDTPATDVARLLGSYAGNDQRLWQIGIDGYRQHADLSSHQQQLVAALDLSTAVLSGMNWLGWLFRDGRQFPNPQAVRERVVSIAARLEQLPVRVADHPISRIA